MPERHGKRAGNRFIRYEEAPGLCARRRDYKKRKVQNSVKKALRKPQCFSFLSSINQLARSPTIIM